MSRPKKLIVLVDPDFDRQSITRFVLLQHGLAVLSASSAYEAAEVGRNAARQPDLLLAFAPVSAEYLAEVAAGIGCPSHIIAPAVNAITKRLDWPPMNEVISRARWAARSKRGPKFKRATVAAVAVAVGC